jgi:hypothetical protein
MTDAAINTEFEVTPEIRDAIAKATNPADIRTMIQAEISKQSQTAADKVAADTEKAAADAAAAAAATPAAVVETKFERTENIGGRDFEFVADSQAELDQMIINAYRVAYTVREDAPASAVVPEVDPNVLAQQLADKEAADIARQAELELKFKRGELSASDYLEQSGAVAAYLEKQGVPLAELKASLEQNRGASFERSWADSTSDFLKSPAGADWPGGEKNKNLLGLKIAELGLVEASDKTAAIAQAWANMKSTGMFFQSEAEPTVAATAPAATAAAPAATIPAAAVAAAPAAAAPAASAPRTASSIFGASSGVGAGEGVSAPAPAGNVKIDPNASPTEIMEEWKRQQFAAGKDPNTAFLETFAAKRA